jgi:hypothetical protein
MAANGLVTVEANRILDDSISTSGDHTTGSTLDLVTTMGTASAAPTKVTGGSYAAQTPTWNSASSASKTNDGAVTFSGLPAATIKGVDLKNTSGGDRRWFGPFASDITTASGDSITFADATGLEFSLTNGT